jgi:TatD DNase family protein
MSPRPRYVDFHCHLDLYPDLAKAIAQCEADRTATLAVTTTPKAFRQNFKLAGHSQFVRVGLGLHPHLAGERKSELALFEALLPETRYVGEIGLDAGPRFFRSMPDQTEVFTRILAMCAMHGSKILSVHSVRTAGKVLDLIEEMLPADRGRVVLHWFSGSKAEARRAVALGCYFSINQAMLEKPKGQELIQSLPTNRLLTETDGPFIEEAGQPIGPGKVVPALRQLAISLALPLDETREMVVNNLVELIR